MNVITLGTFDLFHYGHMNLIRRCMDHFVGDDILYVGLNSDEFIERYKGKRPVMSYEEREKTLLSFGYEGMRVIKNDQKDGTIKDVLFRIKMNDQINPLKLIVVGSDWMKKDYLGQIGLTPDDLDERKIGLAYIPYTKGISTTEIKARL